MRLIAASAVLFACPHAAGAQDLSSIPMPKVGIDQVDQVVTPVQDAVPSLLPPAPDPPPSAPDPASPSPDKGERSPMASSQQSGPVTQLPQASRSTSIPSGRPEASVPVVDDKPAKPGAKDAGEGSQRKSGGPGLAVRHRPADVRGDGRKSGPSPAAPTTIERLVGMIPLPFKIALGALTLLLLAALGVTRRAQRRLIAAERLAVTDSLTGLPNRRHADEVIERLLAASRRNGRPLSVILFDLDRFKAINDNFGHGTGDDVLRATAIAARGLLRGADHVARFGGEEFIVLLPETAAAAAEGVAEKLRTILAVVDVPSLKGALFTASFGIATFPDAAADGHQLLRLADEALYRAKESGRNRVESAQSSTLPRDSSDLAENDPPPTDLLRVNPLFPDQAIASEPVG